MHRRGLCVPVTVAPCSLPRGNRVSNLTLRSHLKWLGAIFEAGSQALISAIPASLHNPLMPIVYPTSAMIRGTLHSASTALRQAQRARVSRLSGGCISAVPHRSLFGFGGNSKDINVFETCDQLHKEVISPLNAKLLGPLSKGDEALPGMGVVFVLG